MAYTFEQIFAADPSNQGMFVSRGVITIFAPGDTTQTPIKLTTVDGRTLANPITVNEAGYGPAFMADLDRVAWAGGGYTGFLTSYDGMKDEAVSARKSADASRVAAEEAARNSAAPTQEAVAQALAAEGPARDAVAQAVAEGTEGLALKPDNGGKPVGKGELVVNIADYGAAGDGVADDRDAFQNAMNYLQSQGGGALTLQRGKKYRVSKSVECADNTTIQGNGATMCKKDSTDWQYAIFQTRVGGGTGYGSGLKNFTVRDLNFTANFRTGRSACAFAANHAENILFDNCNFHEFQGQGHSFDLAGCDGVTISNCIWQGFDNTHGASADGECIQIDNSLNGALSNTETVGSYDGLPTINVTVSNCKFLPLTVDGVTYPCPNPLGGHSRKEGAWHTNIIFENNLIVDPVEDTKSAFRGTIHMIATDGLRITGNTWRVSPGKTAQASRAIGVYSFDKGEGASLDPNVNSGAPLNPISPMICRNVKIEGNTFIGFNNTSQDGNAITISGIAGALIDDVVIRDNTFRGMATAPTDGATFADCIYVSYASNVKILGTTATSCKRAVLCNNSKNVLWADSTLTDMKFGPAYFNAVDGLEIKSLSVDGYFAAMLLFGITGLILSGAKAKSPSYSTSAQFASLRDCTSFLVTGCTLSRSNSVAGSTGISVYGTSGTGYVRGNVIAGYESKATYSGSGSNVTIVDNL